MIKVLCPSRGRPDQLLASVIGLFRLAAEPVSVQVLVALDHDDPSLPEYRDALHSMKAQGLQVQHWIQAREGYGRLWRYYRALDVLYPPADWTLLWNDDARMTQAGWDDMLRAVPEYAMVGDFSNPHSPGLITFPAVRDRAIRILNGFIPDGLETVHIDSMWQEIARRSGTASPLIPAYIQHLRPDLTGDTPDQTYLEGRAHLDHAGFFSQAYQDKLDLAAKHLAGQLLLEDTAA